MRIYKVLTRLYVDNIEKAIDFYAALLHKTPCYRFTYTEMGLELVQIGNFLILAGDTDHVAPFRHTKATLLVDSVEEYKQYLVSRGAVIVRDIKKVPTGYNLTVRHPDGTCIEYVQHVDAHSVRTDRDNVQRTSNTYP